MRNWNKITLCKFQQIDEINSREISELDKILFTVCVVFGLTEYELDNTPKEKAAKLIEKVSQTFSTELKAEAVKKIGKYKINYEPSNLTFGQYIDLSFFLRSKPIQTAHYILASLTSKNADNHKERSEYFLSKPITKIVGTVSAFIEKFIAFNNKYKSLFGIAPEVAGQEVSEDFFNKRYGWIYSASQVAEYERITLEAAMNLPIERAFNDLIFLKAKSKYDAEQLKRK